MILKKPANAGFLYNKKLQLTAVFLLYKKQDSTALRNFPPRAGTHTDKQSDYDR